MEAILEEEEEVEEDSDEEEAGPVHDAIDSSDDTEDKREEEADDDDDEEEHDESIKARMPMFRLLFYGWNDAALRHLIENIVGLLRELPVDDPRLLPMRQRALIVPPLRHLLGDRDARFQTSTLVAALERFAYGHASTDRDEIFSPNDHERCTWRRGLLLIALRRCHYVRELLFTDNTLTRHVFRSRPVPRHVYVSYLDGLIPLVTACEAGHVSVHELVERARFLWHSGFPRRAPASFSMPEEEEEEEEIEQ